AHAALHDAAAQSALHGYYPRQTTRCPGGQSKGTDDRSAKARHRAALLGPANALTEFLAPPAAEKSGAQEEVNQGQDTGERGGYVRQGSGVEDFAHHHV